MNINFTDIELQQILLAAKYTDIDSNTLIHDLVMDEVYEILEASKSTPKAKKINKVNLTIKDKQDINTLKIRNLAYLNIPSAITTFKELTKYLKEHYKLQGNIVFDNNSYELIAKDIFRYKIYPGDLHSYLHYNYPDSNIINY